MMMIINNNNNNNIFPTFPRSRKIKERKNATKKENKNK